jgi:hypothetical protein
MKHFCSFSEAIRAADGVLRQSFFGYHARRLPHLGDEGVCAIEGGVKMLGRLESFGPNGIYTFIKEQYPYLTHVSECPHCTETTGYRETLASLIWHLNDHHHLSFGEIADWLESEEEKLGYVTLTESVESPSESPELTEVTV